MHHVHQDLCPLLASSMHPSDSCTAEHLIEGLAQQQPAANIRQPMHTHYVHGHEISVHGQSPLLGAAHMVAASLYAVLRCAVLCCAVLCCAVLCCAVQ